jgi:hypothetical protein
METYRLYDVFTPTRPAQLTFVERKSIQDKLVDALRTPGKQLVVYGQTGSGKSTLLVNKLHQLYEDHITTRCITGLSFEQIILDAFDQLNRYYTEEFTEKNQKKISSSIAGEYIAIKSKIDMELTAGRDTKEKRVVTPQLTPQRLAKFMGEAKFRWVIEDFHKIEVQEKHKLSQVMKVFMDMAFEYPEVKTIAIGAVGTAREVVQYDSEMRNRVSEISVPLMSDNEIIEILQKGSQLLNVGFSDSISRDIVRYSNGLASVAHQLCLNMCIYEDIQVTCDTKYDLTTSDLQQAIKRYLDEESDTIKDIFDRALRRRRRRGKFDNCRIILRALAKSDDNDGITRGDLMQIIRESEPKYPEGNLRIYLSSLVEDDRGAILRYDPASGLFSFNNPFHKVFAIVFFEQEEQSMKKQSKESQFIDPRIMEEALNKAIDMTVDRMFEIVNEKYILLPRGSRQMVSETDAPTMLQN